MDATTHTGDAVAMDTTNRRKIADLLAEARDITQEVLGGTPPAVVAEVFRQMRFDLEDAQQSLLDDSRAATVH